MSVRDKVEYSLCALIGCVGAFGVGIALLFFDI